MRSAIRLLILATSFSIAVFGTARFSGEKGARPPEFGSRLETSTPEHFWTTGRLPAGATTTMAS